MSEGYLVPRGPSLYVDLVEIIDTSHAALAVDDLLDVLPPNAVERVRGNVREAVRRAYVDGVRDGFVQGVAERACVEARGSQTLPRHKDMP